MKRKWLVEGIILLIIGMSLLPSTAKMMEKDDTTPPVTTCALDPPEPDGQNGWYVNDVTVTLNATDNESGVNVTYYRVNATSWEVYAEPFLISNDGSHIVIEYYSVDNAGNTEPTMIVTCAMDKTIPELFLEYRLTQTVFCGWAITFCATATDATSEMNRVEFYFNNLLQVTLGGSGPEYTWDYPSWYRVRGFIRDPEITEEYVKFYARFVIITGYPPFPIIPKIVISAIAYDNAGNWKKGEIYNPTFPVPIITPGFHLFREISLPNAYTGFIGANYIRASFNNY